MMEDRGQRSEDGGKEGEKVRLEVGMRKEEGGKRGR